MLARTVIRVTAWSWIPSRATAETFGVVMTISMDRGAYGILNDSDLLDDSYDVAETKLEEKNVITYNATFPKEGKYTPNHMDYIFVTDPNSVLEYDVLQDQYEADDGEMRYPSDHFPVVIKIKL